MSIEDTREAPPAGVGKIGRLPAQIRREVARRLLDHYSARSIIEWLSSQPAVQDIWREYFAGAAATDQNISEWKKSQEFRDFVRQQDEIERNKALADFSVRLAQGAGGMASGAVAALGGRIMGLLDSADPDSIRDLVDMAVSLRAAEQRDKELDLKKRNADAKDRALSLTERQIRLREAERFLKWFADEKAQQIAASANTRDDKIKALLDYMERQEKS